MATILLGEITVSTQLSKVAVCIVMQYTGMGPRLDFGPDPGLNQLHLQAMTDSEKELCFIEAAKLGRLDILRMATPKFKLDHKVLDGLPIISSAVAGPELGVDIALNPNLTLSFVTLLVAIYYNSNHPDLQVLRYLVVEMGMEVHSYHLKMAIRMDTSTKITHFLIQEGRASINSEHMIEACSRGNLGLCKLLITQGIKPEPAYLPPAIVSGILWLVQYLVSDLGVRPTKAHLRLARNSGNSAISKFLQVVTLPKLG